MNNRIPGQRPTPIVRQPAPTPPAPTPPAPTPPAPTPPAPTPPVQPANPRGNLFGLPAEKEQVYEEDFLDEDGSGFSVADEGTHYAKVVDFEKTNSKSGNPMYVWQFLITAGPSEGIELKFWTSLTPAGRWKTVQTLEAIGIQAAGSIARFTRSDVIGKECIIEVLHEEYEGRTTHKIDTVYPMDTLPEQNGQMTLPI